MKRNNRGYGKYTYYFDVSTLYSLREVISILSEMEKPIVIDMYPQSRNRHLPQSNTEQIRLSYAHHPNLGHTR